MSPFKDFECANSDFYSHLVAKFTESVGTPCSRDFILCIEMVMLPLYALGGTTYSNLSPADGTWFTLFNNTFPDLP